MNVKEKLDGFSKLAISEAQEKSKKMLAEIEAEFDKAVDDYEETATKKAQIELNEEKFKAERAKNKEILDSKSEVKSSMHELKEQLMDEVISAVMDKIADYHETDDYRHHLLTGISQLARKYKGTIEIYICEQGLAFQDKILETPNLKLYTDNSLLGGFRAVIPESRIIVENSFRERLDSAIHTFSRFSR